MRSVRIERRIGAALLSAGLALVAGYGQTEDLRFDSDFDEERHTKAIYIAICDRREEVSTC